MIIVSDTSPITSLAAVGQLHLLEQLYNNIIIPQAVYDEMTSLSYPVPGAVEVQTLPWIQRRQVTDFTLVRQFNTELDKGESEAIALALELQADLLVIDEDPARKVASRFRLNIIGVLGVLLTAKRRGLILAVKPVMDALIVQASFRISERLYKDVLHFAGENSS